MACNCKKKKINTETNNTIPSAQTMGINNTIKKEVVQNENKDKQSTHS